MALKTQGTKAYFIDPDVTGGPAVVAVDCAISISGISAPKDQLDSTCLEDQARTFLPGLANPGQVTVGLNFDPQSDSHARLLELFKDGTKFEFAIGLSDGTAAPDVDTAGLFDLPTTRSWIVLHDVYVADMPFDIPLNAVVTSNVTIQQSGYPDFFAKS